MKNVAIVGATGAVGQEMLKMLEQRDFPLNNLRCFASARSLGKTVCFRGEEIPLEVLSPNSFDKIDIALFSAGRKISLEYAPIAQKAGAIVIDNSSAFRKDPNVPLVIPEINAHALKGHRGIIANPNCSTIIMLMALAPLHRTFGIKRIVAATYQAASGAGAQAMIELQEETKAALENKPFERSIMPYPYAFNLFTHNSPLSENGYVEEEMKLLTETRKILENDHIHVTATCVRVPVLRAHSEALNVEFHHPITKEAAQNILENSSGVCLVDNPMPIDASGKNEILCGRIREDFSQPNTLNLWVVGDQLLKGAALNAIQIGEHLCHTL